MAAGWMTVPEALARVPDFLRRRGKNSWRFDRRNRIWRSRFGFAQQRVQKNRQGDPDFDRVIIGEAPAMNAVAHGKDENGIVHMAVIVQDRPFVDDPVTLEPADPPITFGHIIMGFLEKVVGKKIAQAFESAQEGAVREAIQEAGVTGILNVRPMGWLNATPTFCATWVSLFEIEVDLKTVTSQIDSAELIHRADYITIKEFLRRLRENDGWVDGVCYRAGSPNGVVLIWLAYLLDRHPEVAAQLI